MELQNSSLNYSAVEYHVKVLVIGDPLIGKSDFISSFVNSESSFQTQVNYRTKKLDNISSRPYESFRFHIWEITDYDENRDIIRTYLENTHIVFLCFSLKNPDSLDSLKYWLNNKKTNLKYLLIGLKSSSMNKIDQVYIKDFCKLFNIEYYCSTNNNYIPFTKFLDDLFPKNDDLNDSNNKNNKSMMNNIIKLCLIL
jgi:GTPase SAR1 family protein